MANLQVKNVPDDVYAELRRRAELDDMTIRDYVLRLIKRDQERMAGKDWERKLLELEPVEVTWDVAESIREDREERQEHLYQAHLENEERRRQQEEAERRRSA
jgi:hypothetical protein